MFFDKLDVQHITGPLLEEDHYYPFGLTMAGISDKAFSGLENLYKYNGKELNHNEFADETGLDWYDYGFRNYDAQIGRFTEEDPLTDNLAALSGYQYAANDPVDNIDVDGLTPISMLCPGTSGLAIFIGKVGQAISNISNLATPIERTISITAHLASVGAVIAQMTSINKVVNNNSVVQGVGGEKKSTISPIFDIQNGKFLGTDNEGYSGKILFMDNNLYQAFSGFGTSTISHKTALSFGTTIENMPFTQQSAIAIGNSFTDIDSRINIRGFKMSNLLYSSVSTYGAIGFYDKDYNYQVKAIGFNNNGQGLSWTDLNEAPSFTDKVNKTITYNLNNEFRPMINTVENVQNLFVHEAGGHWVHGYDASKGLHYKAYELQINHPTFKFTTPYFQGQILNAYKKVKEGLW